MAASRNASDGGGIKAALARLFGVSDSGAAQLFWIVLFLGFLGVGTYWLWQRYGEQVMAQRGHGIGADTIEISTTPPWIRTDIKAETVLTGSLDGLDIRQEDLTLRVAQAFAMHSWVLKVKRVSKKYPARVIVELEYRQPVAMVEVTGGLLPVDKTGVLLPTGDFTAQSAREYLRIAATEASPLGTPGTPWGDDRIVGAAHLAHTLASHWRALDLLRIIARRGPREGLQRSPPVLSLQTRQGTRIIWGNPPGETTPGEPRWEKKVAVLVAYHREFGSLDSLPQGFMLDLRNADRLDIAKSPQ
jgi:hypothetical protein